MRSRKYYFIIIMYGLILTSILLGVNNIFGCLGDWNSQHTVIPDYFRKLFYETGNLIPNFAFNLGAGQNIFNFSYYGLMNPFILLSYLLPFVPMKVYIATISIIIQIVSSILIFKFLDSHNYSKKICLFSSLAFLTLSPIIFHSHYHIMFVWYFPFLIMSLFGVDRYVKDNKSFLLMISIFLVLLTNYYYGATSILVIAIYGIYQLIKKNDNLKSFIKDFFKAMLRVIIPILLACFILLPTFYTIINSGRITNVNINLLDLFSFQINESMYSSYSMGISSFFIISIIGNMCLKKTKKEDYFLSLALLIITFIPIFMYVLNGFLYIRGKVLIPFIILYIISSASFIKNIYDNNINYKKMLLITSLIVLLVIVTNLKNIFLIIFLIDIILTFIFLYFFIKKKKYKILFIPLMIILITLNIFNNLNSEYITKEQYETEQNQNEEIEKLINYIENDDFYRTNVEINSNRNVNKYWNENYYGSTIYSSSYNSNYYQFYNFEFGNNIPYRNSFIIDGNTNELFNSFMGVKYIVAKKNKEVSYEKIKESENYALYYNENAYPIIYTVNTLGSLKQYEDLSFPYNVEYLLKYPVLETENNQEYETNIRKIKLDLKQAYEINIDKKVNYNYQLNESIKNKYLIISFDIDNDTNSDRSITINGVKNKLTSKDWYYYNNNKTFEYVIYVDEEITSLDIEITKGKYNISNIHLYTMDKVLPKYEALQNINIDKEKSIITGKTSLESDSYVITSIPYDKGFKAYVDGTEVKTEKVNQAFLGFKVSKGEHSIKIEYNSPFYKEGLILSLLGLFLMFITLILENKKIINFIKKYKELTLYVIFGFLTTIVSLAIYFITTNTFLDVNNALELQMANIISWFIAVLFAYITNKKYVFAKTGNSLFKEMLSFYLSRIASLLIDMFLMFILVSVLMFNDTIIKILVQIIVIVTNYLFSKYLVFKGSEK